MKRIISLKKVSPFLTEVFRDNVKIGTIDYQNTKDYQINLDDTIAQAVMDADIAEIKLELEKHMNEFTNQKKNEIESYKNEIVMPEFLETVTRETNGFLNSVDAETENVRNLLGTDYNHYKTELESLVNINNFEKIIGKNFKGPYNPEKNYQNGDIFYKDSLNNISFSMPNISAPALTKNLVVEKIGKFLIFGEEEQEFQLCNNKQFGIVGLNLGKTLIKEGELPLHKNLIGTVSKYQY